MSLNSLLLAVVPVSLCALVIYRLLLHPLAKVPGPKLAAVTSWYEFYYDCILGGKYCFKIDELHKRYGPCVRINPWEVHIKDPTYWDVLYSNSGRLDKESWYYGGFFAGATTVSTVSHELHRVRRGAMSTYFSTANVRRLEPVVLSRVQKLCDRMEEYRRDGRPVNLSNVFRCLATDVVTHFAFPKPRSMLDTPNFSANFTRLLRETSSLIQWQRHLYVIFPVMLSLPEAITVKMDSTGGTRQMIEYQQSYFEQSKMAVDGQRNANGESQRSILDAIASSAELSSSDKTVKRIADEAQLIVGAGTETTGATLALFIYHVLAKPTTGGRLRAELRSIDGDSDGYLEIKVLDKLPYLQACLAEALRIASPVSGRLPRVNPKSDMTYTDPTGKEYIFPKGTAMSMSMRDMHFDETIFPNPETFDPERWLQESSANLSKLEQAFVPFSRGNRNCIGQGLAKQELALTVGNLLRRFDMVLFESSARDIAFVHDYFAPFSAVDSRGLQVMLH